MKHTNKTIAINGPLNVIRLESKESKENKINKKVIYLFGDYHLDVQNQTECNDVKSIDLKDYLINMFENNNKTSKTIDFLLEIYPTQKYNTQTISYYKFKYIHSVSKMFLKLFNYDIQKNKVDKPKLFNKLRLHYLDIRDYLGRDNFDVLNNISSFIYTKDILQLKDSVSLLTAHTKNIYDMIYNSNKTQNKKSKPIIALTAEILATYTDKDLTDNTKYLINKIHNKYTNTNIQNKINNIIINKDLMLLFNTFFKNSIDFTDFLDSNANIFDYPTNKLFLSDIIAGYGVPLHIENNLYASKSYFYEKLKDTFHDVYTLLTDIYFLRRFLDKNYITNTIVYTGIAHTSNYVYYLVKYFDFEITHAAYLHKDYNIQTINDKIKSLDNSRLVDQLIFPDELVQCSVLKDFPSNFD